MGYKPQKTMVIDVYTNNIEGKLRVKADTEDEALKLVQKLGFKVSGIMPDYGFTIKLPPRRF